MKVSAGSQTRSDVIGPAPDASARRMLLVVSEDERCVSGSLMQAVRHEFPWLDVRLLGSLLAACGRFPSAVPLVLVDVALSYDLRRLSSDLSAAHPLAAVAFLTRGEPSQLDHAQVLGTPGLRGVLPMNLPLDIWLAALRVLLLGGEYYCGIFAKARPGQAMAWSDANSDIHVPSRAQAAPFADLTAREIQILELVARGRQNKVIASALGLSEHTVKIHIHNVIAKLGVHNRTEAAGFFLEQRKTPPLAAPSLPSIEDLSP